MVNGQQSTVNSQRSTVNGQQLIDELRIVPLVSLDDARGDFRINTFALILLNRHFWGGKFGGNEKKM